MEPSAATGHWNGLGSHGAGSYGEWDGDSGGAWLEADLVDHVKTDQHCEGKADADGEQIHVDG